MQASDKGSVRRKASAKVIVNVLDLNDNKPTFQPRTVHIPEDFQVNTLPVISLSAQDADSGINAQVVFSMETNNVPFSITTDGVIKTTQTLDRESIDSYRLKIKVADRGTNPSSLYSENFVHVKITDVNDNRPDFEKNQYTCKIRENSPSNSHVCYVKATDADLGENARVTYRMPQNSEFDVTVRFYLVQFI